MLRTGASTLPHAGRGLFAAQDFAIGEVVAEMVKPRPVAGERELARQLEAAGGLPHDLAVHDGFGGVVLDVGIDPHTDAPVWYLMNHGGRRAGNCRHTWNRCTDGAVSSVSWRAIRHIAAGEELLYDYGEPDPAWASLGAASPRSRR